MKKITLLILTAAAVALQPAAGQEAELLSEIARPAAGAASVAQENACESAQDYLDVGAFSRKGLIKQLRYEGYSAEDAAYAVDAVAADWNEQAAAAAQEYLDAGSFSRVGLIKQLQFEGYTREQAVYGVDQTGL